MTSPTAASDIELNSRVNDATGDKSPLGATGGYDYVDMGSPSPTPGVSTGEAITSRPTIYQPC